MRPVILVTPDYEEERYFLKRAYADAVAAAGGLPVVVPYAADVEALLGIAGGVVVTGGAFDIAPESYGEARRDGCGPQKDERTRFEWALLEGALSRGLPLLGICGGMQLLNVVRGGSLFQDIGAEIAGAGPHEQKTPRHELAHPIRTAAGSRLARLVAAGGPAAVNTTHHQAVKAVGQGLAATVWAEDGVIEAIEDPAARYLVGVQWHPELLGETAPWNRALFAELVDAAR
ncbi:gamma-glutamyl-gamma-aminobutyrate hydrolase family protein [Vulgatibacter sp.]|uniref:gamma-glutamyl-gamma-aminobutyrate hydrolase family protein n=1 Tax=Vulgatibacter sp. TaxID=1971226 RepID=UPI003565088F